MKIQYPEVCECFEGLNTSDICIKPLCKSYLAECYSYIIEIRHSLLDLFKKLSAPPKAAEMTANAQVKQSLVERCHEGLRLITGGGLEELQPMSNECQATQLAWLTQYYTF